MDEDKNPLTERRIENATAARTLWNKFRTASLSRREKWAQVQNQLDGAPPFANSALVKTGQGWRCNINFRDAASTLEQVMIAYWRLLHDTTNLVAVTFHGEDPNSERWAQIFQDNFNRFIDDWGADYVRNYLLFSQNHVAYGVGLVLWNDRFDPCWEVIRLGEIEVPNKAKASIEKLKVAGIRQEMDIEDLWELVRTPEKRAASSKLGWNIGALDTLLAREIKNIDSNRSVEANDILETQRQLRNNSLGLSTGHEPLKFVHLLVKEHDGKITRYIFAETKDHGPDFLFEDNGAEARPESMDQITAAVFFDAGNGDFWGTKGFGVKNYPLATIMNRLKSRAVDRTLIDGLNFRDLEEGGRQIVPVTVQGPFTFLPKNVEQIQSYPSGRSVLETIEMLEQQQSFNNARYRDQTQQIAKTDTATQANILAGLQAAVDVANATLYLKQIARNIFSEQLRRLRMRGNNSKAAVNFRRRCVDDMGMDEKVFHDADISVRTGADPGAASLALQAEYALQVGQQLPDADRRWWQEKVVSTRFGAQAVGKALRPVSASSDIKSQNEATVENDVMGDGHPMQVDPSDNHAAHVPIHLQPLMVITDRFDSTGQIDPNALIALQNVIPHLDAHFEYLKKDKLQEALFKQLWPEFTKVRSAAEGIFRLVQRMHDQAQQAAAAGQAAPGQPGAPTPAGAQPGAMSPAAAVGAGTPQAQAA